MSINSDDTDEYAEHVGHAQMETMRVHDLEPSFTAEESESEHETVREEPLASPPSSIRYRTFSGIKEVPLIPHATQEVNDPSSSDSQPLEGINPSGVLVSPPTKEEENVQI